MKFVFLLVAFIALVSAAEVQVVFQLKEGNVTLTLDRKWCPNGFDRFMNLVVNESYYNDVAFFRVVPNFVVQFGINGNPTLSGKWRNQNIQDDPVVKSNTRGWVSYAAMPQRHTRTTQLFINLVNNTRLDGMGFSPFAFINEKDMKIIDKINSQYREQPNQNQIYTVGNSYLKNSFPNLTYLMKASVKK